MQRIDYDDIDVRIHYTCPDCDNELTEILDREPDEFDADCGRCGAVFTVNCYGDI